MRARKRRGRPDARVVSCVLSQLREGAGPPGASDGSVASGEAQAERPRSLIIKEKGNGRPAHSVRVGPSAQIPDATADLSVRQTGGLFARIAPRTDGILVPMRRNSQGHENGAVAGVKVSVSLRFQ